MNLKDEATNPIESRRLLKVFFEGLGDSLAEEWRRTMFEQGYLDDAAGQALVAGWGDLFQAFLACLLGENTREAKNIFSAESRRAGDGALEANLYGAMALRDLGAYRLVDHFYDRADFNHLLRAYLAAVNEFLDAFMTTFAYGADYPGN